jgi:calcium-binding protein CML
MTGPNIPPSQMSLRPEQFEELKSLFRSFDRNHDGIISREELYNVLTSMGMRPNDEQLDAMVKEETYPESIYECQR